MPQAIVVKLNSLGDGSGHKICNRQIRTHTFKAPGVRMHSKSKEVVINNYSRLQKINEREAFCMLKNIKICQRKLKIELKISGFSTYFLRFLF